MKKLTVFLCQILLVTGCNSSDDGKSLVIDFAKSDRQFTPLFSDYPPSSPKQNNEVFYELSGLHQALPEPFNGNKGWRLHGRNASDDLFMSIIGYIDGFTPETVYSVSISIDIVTNVSSNCAGIGGAPGESVYVKVGATTDKPKNKVSNDGGDKIYRLNLDKGNQSQSGTHAVNIGNIANGVDCEAQQQLYKKKTLSTTNSINVKTNDAGGMWLIAGTDSGFEGITHYYIKKLSVVAER